MERIGKILEQSQKNTPTLKPFEPDPEPTGEEKKERLRLALNLTSWENTFENFKNVRGTGAALAAFKLLGSGEASWQMLLCYGTAGNGKTHLCEALSITLVQRNIFCSVVEWSEKVRDFKKAMRSELQGAYDDLFERFRKIRYMIIDDVGSGSTGSYWEWGELEDIVNYRYRDKNHEGLVTVVTSNLDINDLPDRIVSRFRDAKKGRLILNQAEDYRPKVRNT